MARKKLTPRGRALHWLTKHRGIAEDPPGSNSDHRKDGIAAAQRRLANGAAFLDHAPWCGVWAASALLHAGVKGVTSRLASVAFIEDDARAHRAPFRGWVQVGDKRWRRRVKRGDLVVLFGRGVHVGTVRAVFLRWVLTSEGNTSPGRTGSQDNGGVSANRWRSLSDVHGFALVKYPKR
ncbi:MAG TPA: hypothetical protein VFT50_09420 [Baekduia sp.]|nr:hypothetical protein [Baekduia sp.]